MYFNTNNGQTFKVNLSFLLFQKNIYKLFQMMFVLFNHLFREKDYEANEMDEVIKWTNALFITFLIIIP